MKKGKICASALLMAGIMSFYGCDQEVSNIQSIGGGSCLFVNHTTKDSVLVSGGIVIGYPERIYVHNGDMLEMTFIPEHDYEKYNFEVVYTLMDGTQQTCTNRDYTYKMTISDWGARNGTIMFRAIKKDDHTDITASGSINITLLDNN